MHLCAQKQERFVGLRVSQGLLETFEVPSSFRVSVFQRLLASFHCDFGVFSYDWCGQTNLTCRRSGPPKCPLMTVAVEGEDARAGIDSTHRTMGSSRRAT